ncbi:MAG: hypothetical protein WB949_11865 [Candidatus Acidiferrales bacterium]
MKAPQPKSAGSPKRQLDSFLARFTPEIAMLARRALAKMRKRLPNAIELVYDNYNALVIGFGPNERPSDAIFSIAIFPRKVGLCFLQGAKLPDPDKRLKGSGNVVRSVTLNDLSILDDPQIGALIDVALLRAKVRMDPKQKRKLIIRSISAKQRPRRPA